MGTGSKPGAPGGSRIFVGHRALGLVSNHVPIVDRYIRRRREHLVVTCVGRVFHTYGCSKLGLLSVSKEHPEDITCVAADSYLVFAASGGSIYAWRRGSELKHIYRPPPPPPPGKDDDEEDDGDSPPPPPVTLLLPFGPHLISVDAYSVLRLWDIKSEDMVSELEFPSSSFSVTALCHPPTYVNKVLLGSAQGRMQLWNLRTLKKVHTFKGWPEGRGVACLEAAPAAVDVVAVGLKSGDIILHNLRFDETVVKFKQDWGPVTGLSFRSDGKAAVLASASSAGHVALWDLEERRLLSQMRDCHRGSVTGLRCLPGEPLMVTSSPDNTIKQWIFDLSDGGGRLLRLREGHSAPPTRIRFYGALGQTVLSAGEDSTLRSFSTVTEVLNKSFGVASYNRKLSKKHKQLSNPVKMEPIVDFTAETTRDGDWSNVVCAHRASASATAWSHREQRMTDMKLRHQRFKEDRSLRDAAATCVCISVCGNFVVVGYDSGHVDRFNVQSGLHRGAFVAKGFEGQQNAAAHPGRKIRAVSSDGLNQTVLSADDRGGVKFWRFDPTAPSTDSSDSSPQLGRLSLSAGVVAMSLHRDSSLAAAALADVSIVVLDAQQRTVVRRFEEAHLDQVTDLCFSGDSRWVVSASLDRTVKVWDVPTGHLVDRFRFSPSAGAVTSLSLSPTGEFLATSHAGGLGVHLWTNSALYRHLSLRPISEGDGFEECPEMLVPLTTVEEGGEGSNKARGDATKMEIDDDEEEEVENDAYVSPEQLAPELVTLSDARDSSSDWRVLLNIDVVRARNRPKNPVKKPSDAPFFLPTVGGLGADVKFDLDKETRAKDGEEEKNPSVVPVAPPPTAFAQSLLSAEGEEELAAALEGLKGLGPAKVETEIRSLSPSWGGSAELLRQFLRASAAAAAARKGFEASQAQLALFLKLHGQELITEGLSDDLEAAASASSAAAAALSAQLDSAASLAAFCRNALI